MMQLSIYHFDVARNVFPPIEAGPFFNFFAVALAAIFDVALDILLDAALTVSLDVCHLLQ
jgi:hypothetical protein